MQQQNTSFYHQRLDAYQVALEFAQWQSQTHVSGPLKSQLERAAESVVLNLAEGAQQFSRAVAKRHYRIALGSAAECSAALDLLALRGTKVSAGQRLIGRVGLMLRRLAR